MHSFSSSLHHCIFATKAREPSLTPKVRDRLWPYLGGIARENAMKALAIGGVADHVHILLSLPATMSVAKAMQLLKGNSSKWIHETFSELRSFAWQEGYGAFSIGVSGVEETRAYIRSQEEHHRNRTYREEVIMFLQRHGLRFEDSMLE
ncbi:MAG TPA: IS200/IS605 family transposase [Chthoniobacterales bacterium]|jgi:REP element-mobilizing transposase RayT|nr:IS200/IS605 family transposase [Chthoniobacterales bacterium]